MSHDEQQIRQLVMDWMEATRKGDMPAVLRLMAEDVVFLVPGQPPMVGRAGFEAAARSQGMASRARPAIEGTSEIQEIQVLGEWAYMWTRLKVVVTPPDGSPSMIRAGHTLSILRKENGKWVIARDANLLAPVPSERV